MDKYAALRATLEMNATLKMSQAFYPDTIRALLADYDRATALEAANARLREALEAERDALREVAQAALAYDSAIQSCANNPDAMSSFCTAEGDDLDSLYADWISKARAALAQKQGD